MTHDCIRKAALADVPAIHKMLSAAARDSSIIPRSKAEIYETLRDFHVVDAGDGCQGCCALHITWEDLAEVKSLAVADALKGQGYGRALVAACLEEARAYGLPKVFALTGIPDFFVRMGFRLIEKSELPHKVWGECVRCPKFPDCDEEAVRIDFP